ncbi:MAG: superoxide dismutase [Ni] [Planctomycetota bacterium]|jgi:nickel superoxide dismutase
MHRSVFLTAAAAGVAASFALASLRPTALAHCEVPCGIYTDHARIGQMLEDTTTITKAIDQIRLLDRQPDPLSFNQAARWVQTKDEHATRIQHTIAQYFLTQRIKPAEAGTDAWAEYVERLARHHAVMVAAMKTKQNVDPDSARALQAAIEQISAYYPAPAAEHDHDH